MVTLKFSEDEINTATNALRLARDKYKEFAEDMRQSGAAATNRGASEGWFRLARQFDRQVDEAAALMSRFLSEEG